MFLIEDTVKELRSIQPRKLVTQMLGIGMVLGSALFFWHICMIVGNNESPIVVVLSGNKPVLF